MAEALRVLIVDDSEDDAFLLIRFLKRAGFDITWQRVDTRDAMVKALDSEHWDIVLSDFSMPSFSGMDALRIIRDGQYPSPVILVSGAIGEETAVEAMKTGAQDYVLKDNLTRLAPAVERTLREAQNRRARLQAEAALKESQANLLAETRQRLQELDHLNRISARLRMYNTSQEMLPGFLEEASKALNSPHGALMLFRSNAVQLEIALAQGALAAYQGMEYPITNAVEGFLSGETGIFHTPDIHSNFMNVTVPIPEVIGPMMAIPLQSAEAVLGMLIVGRDHGTADAPAHPYQDSDLHLAGTIAELGGNSLQRARLFEQTQQRVQRLSILHEIDMAVSASLSIEITLNLILDQIVTHLNMTAADVLTYNTQAHWLEYVAGSGFRSDKVKRTRIRLGHSLPGKALLDRKTVFIPDIHTDAEFIQTHNLEGDDFRTYFALPLFTKGQIKGVLELFHREPLTIDLEFRDFFESLAAQTAIAMDNSELFDGLKRSNLELTRSYDAVIETWARSFERREPDFVGHAERTVELAIRLANALKVGDVQLLHMRRGALLHDIGKIGIPENLLLKRDPLTEEDWKVIHQHPRIAYEMLSRIDFLLPALDIPYYHHERWDGSGYPQGIKGEQIPLAARIFAVVDVWDSLNTDRFYRSRWPREKVIRYIREGAGTLFDPMIAEAFLSNLPPAESDLSAMGFH